MRQDLAPEPSPTGGAQGPLPTFLMQAMCQALPGPFLRCPVLVHGAFLFFITILILLLLAVTVLC